MKIIESFDDFNKKLDEYDKVYKEIQDIKKGLRALIENLPDNENITRLGGNTFTVKSSSVFGNPFTPEYHDFKKQYKMISDSLEDVDPKQFKNKLNEILDKKVITVKGIRYTLNPDVIDNIRKIIQ